MKGDRQEGSFVSDVGAPVGRTLARSPLRLTLCNNPCFAVGLLSVFPVAPQLLCALTRFCLPFTASSIGSEGHRMGSFFRSWCVMFVRCLLTCRNISSRLWNQTK